MRAFYTIGRDRVRLSAKQPVRLEEVTIPVAIAPHDHEFYELCWILGGSVIHRTAEGARELTRGDMVIVPPRGVHAFARPRRCTALNGYYLGEWLLSDLRSLWRQSELVRLFLAAHLFPSRQAPLPRVLTFPGKFLRHLHAALRQIMGELERPNPSPVYLRASFVKLLIEISREAETAARRPGRVSLRSELQTALEEIESCLAGRQTFSVRQASAKAGISPEHLARLFSAQFGLSIRSYFQKRRVQMACAALLDADRSLSEIAFDLGFSDPAHFHRSFKQVMGETPRRYRRQYLLAAPAP